MDAVLELTKLCSKYHDRHQMIGEVSVLPQGIAAEVNVEGGAGASPSSPRPSVAASTLHMYANPNKLRPGRHDDNENQDHHSEEGGDAEDESEYSGSDRGEFGDDDVNVDYNDIEPAPALVNPHVQTAAREAQFADQMPTARRGGGGIQYTPAENRERIRLIARIRRRQGEGRQKLEAATLGALRIMSAGAGYEARAKTAVQMMRRFTMFFARVIETISSRYPKLAGDLSGWSESVYMQLDSYDEMLYDIYDEYGDHLQANPIVMYLMALGSNAVMFAMAKKVINHPATGAVLSDLASAFRQQVKPGGPSTPGPPPPRDKQQAPPAVPISETVAGLGNLDLNSLFSNLSGILSGNKENVSPPDNPVRDETEDEEEETEDDGNVMSLKSLLRTSEDIMQSKDLSSIEEGDEEDE